jgi:hypothetical protein
MSAIIDTEKVRRDGQKLNHIVKAQQTVLTSKDWERSQSEVGDIEELRLTHRNVSERMKKDYLNKFLFMIVHQSSTTGDVQFCTGYNLQRLIADGGYSFVYVGHPHKTPNFQQRYDLATALVTLRSVDCQKHVAEKITYTGSSHDTILAQLNLTTAKYKSLKKTVQDIPLWEIEEHESSDFTSKNGTPSWLTELVSEHRAG